MCDRLWILNRSDTDQIKQLLSITVVIQIMSLGFLGKAIALKVIINFIIF